MKLREGKGRDIPITLPSHIADIDQIKPRLDTRRFDLFTAHVLHETGFFEVLFTFFGREVFGEIFLNLSEDVAVRQAGAVCQSPHLDKRAPLEGLAAMGGIRDNYGDMGEGTCLLVIRFVNGPTTTVIVLTCDVSICT